MVLYHQFLLFQQVSRHRCQVKNPDRPCSELLHIDGRAFVRAYAEQGLEAIGGAVESYADASTCRKDEGLTMVKIEGSWQLPGKFKHVVLTIGLLWLGATRLLVAQDRPGLFFREDWKEIAAVTPITQEHVANPDLILSLYGPGKPKFASRITTSPSMTLTTCGRVSVREIGRSPFDTKVHGSI